jgi:predicted AAA+ superfamily ATPase
MYIDRLLTLPLRTLADAPIGRGLVLTGARQAGKTTLLRGEFEAEYEYFSFDEALSRVSLARRPAADWLARGSSFIFDEVHKAPEFIGTVKVILDEGPPEQRVILSGSAQIRLLSGVRETLAGRVVTRELFPLTVSELAGVEEPLLVGLLSCSSSAEIRGLLDEVGFESTGEAGIAAARASRAFEEVLEIGGMPAIRAFDEAEHRWLWLREYCQTYLQRDVADLGRVADLDDFVRLERIAARRTACTLNYADLARDADLSPVTAKKYLRYLELSYQSFRLESYRSRREKRMIKAPRLHWMDLGVQRTLSGMRSGLSGEQLETAVVAEIHKLVETLQLEVELSYLRTRDGREVDLVATLPGGDHLAFEIKAGGRASTSDARHLRGLEHILDGQLLTGFVIYLGNTVDRLDENLYAIPAGRLFGPGR